MSAIIAAGFVIWIIAQAKHLRQNRLGNAVLVLLCVQFGLGLLDIVLLAPVWMQIAHLLGADLYWIALIALTAKVAWDPQSQSV